MTESPTDPTWSGLSADLAAIAARPWAATSTSRPPLTDGSWLPIAQVLSQLTLPANQAGQQLADADRARLAAAAQVERARPDLVMVGADGSVVYAADADVVLGALMLAARLYARKGSPQGLASYGDFGPAPVTRLDPDIERLLGVGRYARPAVG